MEHYGTASTHPHNCVQTSWHAEHFWFWKFRGRRFLIPSLIPLKCDVPMDTTRSPSVQRVASWCSWGRSQPGGRWFRQLTFIWAGPYTIFRFRISNHMSFTHTISSRMTHKVLMCIHKHHHGTPSGCPHKRILHILATTSLPCPMIHSLGAHWVLTWCSLGAHLVLTGCSSGAHWVLTGCSLTQLGSPAMMHLQSCTTVPNNEKHAFRCRGVSKNRCSRTPCGIQHMLWT